MNKLSFEIKKDANAEPYKRWILCVKYQGRTVEAPRCESLNSALTYAANYIEYDGGRGKIKIEITL